MSKVPCPIGGNQKVATHPRKVWRQLQREGFDVARCTVARLMKAIGNIPPAEAEERYYAMLDEPAIAA